MADLQRQLDQISSPEQRVAYSSLIKWLLSKRFGCFLLWIHAGKPVKIAEASPALAVDQLSDNPPNGGGSDSD